MSEYAQKMAALYTRIFREAPKDMSVLNKKTLNSKSFRLKEKNRIEMEKKRFEIYNFLFISIKNM